MDEKLKQVEQTLAKYGQEQLLDEYNRLTKINTTGKVKVLKIS